ncbi:hypothetical protein Rhopal_002515-T1 [Rhodotorula paludigena]|uniref:F-box domain-containing protein n=1 Tax=Rhodotorula paludigena TaxID=86838 RepID=A0AAV5GLI3_9BASI|nr:hypothetical protein Rhopal_002515-T1 [Rhodotorula paludigena]
MSLLDLPIELLELVADELRRSDPLDVLSHHLPRKSGFALALTCRHTYRLGLDLLYRNVRISSASSAPYLNAILHERSVPYDLIRDLSAHVGLDTKPTPRQVASIFSASSNLRSISVRGDPGAIDQILRLLHRGACMRHLRSLYISGVGGGNRGLASTVLRLLPRFPELQELTIYLSKEPYNLAGPSRSESPPSSLGYGGDDNFDIDSFLRCFRTHEVKTLTIGYGVPDFAEQAALLAATPGLEQLCVCGHGDSAVGFLAAALPHIKSMSRLRKLEYSYPVARSPLLAYDDPILCLLFDSLPPSLEHVELDLIWNHQAHSGRLQDFLAEQVRLAQPLRRWQWYELLDGDEGFRRVTYERETGSDGLERFIRRKGW